MLYARPTTLAEATADLAKPGSAPMGGGTDLLVSIEEGFVSAQSLVDLRHIAHNAEIVERPDGSVRIGAAARIHEVAASPLVVEQFKALAEACGAVGTPALREMGTIGGNLCQRPRCWYLRRGVSCFKSSGSSCPAKEGENQYHAILEGGPCFIVHPSDSAVALTALDAAVEINGVRVVPISEFYLTPAQRLDHETILRPGEFVTGVILPAESRGGKQHYAKLMQRGAWDFALVSAAAIQRRDTAVRIVLGGVAPRPWRVPESLEEDVEAGNLDEDAIAVISARALYDARPLAQNAYKVRLAETLIRRCVLALLA